MTIQRYINPEHWNERLNNLESCADNAPAGTYEEGKRIARAIGDAIEGVRGVFKAAGFQADGSDNCRTLEALIYAYFVASNESDDAVFSALCVSEGFGDAMNGPARDRVLAQTIRDRDFLARHRAENTLFAQLAPQVTDAAHLSDFGDNKT